ncbi:unnamed protein product, partial [Ixodes hexagonus]
ADQELRNIIDKLAQFVARNGPEFEQMTKQKQKDNPKFSFLFGGEYYAYYQHQVSSQQACEVAALDRSSHPQIRQTTRIPHESTPNIPDIVPLQNGRKHAQRPPAVVARAPSASQPNAIRVPPWTVNPGRSPPYSPPPISDIGDGYSNSSGRPLHPGSRACSPRQPPRLPLALSPPPDSPANLPPTPSSVRSTPRSLPSEENVPSHASGPRMHPLPHTRYIPAPSTAAPSTMALAQLQQQVQEIQEQIRQSEQNLAAQHQVLLQQQQVQLDEAIRKAQDDKLTAQAKGCDLEIAELDKVLQPIIESCTKDAISAGKGWIFTHSTTPERNELICQYLLKKVTVPGAPFDMKLHIVYLINDVLHHCVRKNADGLKQALEQIVVPIFCTTSIGVDEEKGQKLAKLLKLWETNKYFAPLVLEQLKNPAISLANYQASLITEHAAVITSVTSAVQVQYAQLQKQHQDFVAHLTSRLQTIQYGLLQQTMSPAAGIVPGLPPPRLVVPQGPLGSAVPHSLPANTLAPSVGATPGTQGSPVVTQPLASSGQAATVAPQSSAGPTSNQAHEASQGDQAAQADAPKGNGSVHESQEAPKAAESVAPGPDTMGPSDRMIPSDASRPLDGMMSSDATRSSEVMRPDDDGMRPDGMRPDMMRPDDMRQDGMRPDGMRPDMMRPDDMRQDGMRPDGMRPDMMRPDDMRHDGMRPDAMRPDMMRPDDMRQDGMRPDGMRLDMMRLDDMRPDGMRPDMMRLDDMRQDGMRPDLMRPDGMRPLDRMRPSDMLVGGDQMGRDMLRPGMNQGGGGYGPLPGPPHYGGGPLGPGGHHGGGGGGYMGNGPHMSPFGPQPPPHYGMPPAGYNHPPPSYMHHGGPQIPGGYGGGMPPRPMHGYDPMGDEGQYYDDYDLAVMARALSCLGAGPGLGLPDVSQPPPGFVTLDSQGFPPPDLPEAMECLVPTMPYFELPAGLIVPLVKLEDNEYKPLDPKALRLPPPAPPSDALMQAVEMFYGPPSHERPRNSEGWEQLGLYEFFKAKSQVVRTRPSQDSDDGGDDSQDHKDTKGKDGEDRPLREDPNRRRYRESKSPPHTKQEEDAHRRKKKRSRSRSESASPPRRHRPSRSRSRSKSRSRSRSRSVSPSKKRSPERSPTPPSFFGSSYGGDPRDSKLDESNKGHQLLRKMGWGGAGLGAAEQGIQDPIHPGDVRDRQDLYKGVGISLHDPYENFRKSKGQAFINRMKARSDDIVGK